MRVVWLPVLAVAALAAIGCGEDDPYFDASPNVADRAPDGRDWRRLRTVREFGPSQKLTPAEVRLTRRIIARDASLASLLHDAGGHTVSRIGPVTPGGTGALVGGVADVRLASPITGTYRLPAACVDLDGEFVPVGPTDYRFEGVETLMVEVSFADDAVFEAQPDSGDYDTAGDDPGTWPQSCRDAAEQDIGR